MLKWPQSCLQRSTVSLQYSEYLSSWDSLQWPMSWTVQVARSCHFNASAFVYLPCCLFTAACLNFLLSGWWDSLENTYHTGLHNDFSIASPCTTFAYFSPFPSYFNSLISVPAARVVNTDCRCRLCDTIGDTSRIGFSIADIVMR